MHARSAVVWRCIGREQSGGEVCGPTGKGGAPRLRDNTTPLPPPRAARSAGDLSLRRSAGARGARMQGGALARARGGGGAWLGSARPARACRFGVARGLEGACGLCWCAAQA
ncbi:hypothetical protein Rsub_08479 [Raphidocelis subcapitata]|uniref:Uncharacterized protein n=1 Tax=Raphidocelis subcapitata TaxID=307507 RepID=A0A2V0P7Q0_9CHLO|nr:hypothetical protein Rsub_08479 [Raphidocelis subcapitata]|eukprot:GBF95888.1 hypothetical protein Rsub_08479 [Raphidocelis subcapitata]